MKRLLLPLILFLLAVVNGFSQAPARFNYQAVARDASGAFLALKPVAVVVTLTDDLGNTYTESHSKTTNQFGLFSLEIGGGTTSNDFSSLKWAEGKVTISISVNGNLIGSGVELLSVPYALYSNTAGTVTTRGGTGGGIKEINGDTTSQQKFVLDTSSIAELKIVNDLKGTNTIGLPVLKSTSTSTAGLLSKADYDKLDSLDFRRLRRIGIADGSVIIFNGQLKKWEVKPLPSTSTLSTGKGLNIINNKITLNIDSTTLDTAGSLSVKHIDVSKIKTIGSAENQILKVQNGKLKFVPDSAIQYKSKSLKIDGDTIDLKPGTTENDVLTWKSGKWVAFQPTSGSSTCINTATYTSNVSNDCSGARFSLSPTIPIDVTKGQNVIIEVSSGNTISKYNIEVVCPSSPTIAKVYFDISGSIPEEFGNASSICILTPLPTGSQAPYNAGTGIDINPSKTISAKNTQAIWDAGSIGNHPVDTTLTTIDKSNVLTWDGIQWTAKASSGNGWSLTGNAGTTAGVNYIGTNDPMGFKIKTNKVTKMTIDATGNVLFGKLSTDSLTAPRAAFEQRGNSKGVAAIFGGEGAGVSLSSAAIGFNQYFPSSSNLSISKGYGGSISLDPSSGSMKFGISKTPAISADETYTSNTMVTLTKEGKVGINTIAPKSFLVVNGGILVDSFQLNPLKAKDGYVLTTDADGNGTWQASKGSLPNAVTNQTLYYTGSKWDTSSFLSNTGSLVTIGNNASKGNTVLTVNGRIKTDNITESSDSRYKTDVNKLENALAKVNAVNGVSYFWKSDSLKTKKDIGVIAQELEKVFPELVDTDEAGYKSVRYSHLVPVLIEAIKEQQKQIESLKTEISTKENKVRNNESRIQTLETSMKSMATQMQLLLELVGKNEGIKASK